MKTGVGSRWLSILETSGVIYLLQPYMANTSNRIIKSPKLYFMDTGLCSFLWRKTFFSASTASSALWGCRQKN
ncbi:MAG: DUF4143 domain-containing protein [Treponema sp.]|nr:DUF4143 domain-containing protein [Treponema sp.]